MSIFYIITLTLTGWYKTPPVETAASIKRNQIWTEQNYIAYSVLS